MKKKYLNPIKNCLNDIALIPTDDENSAFYTMQIEIMKDLLHKIDQKINQCRTLNGVRDFLLLRKIMLSRRVYW